VPEKKSVILLVFLSIITLGIYPAIWHIKRVSEFNNLGTQKKIGKIWGIIYLIALITLLIFQVVIMPSTISSATMGEENSSIVTIAYIIFIVTIIGWISAIIASFKERAIINQVWESKRVTRRVSWFFTLIFNFLYVQYEINRTIENKENEKRVGPWIAFIFLYLIPLVLWIISIVLGLFVIASY
jgi:hypothetical protein